MDEFASKYSVGQKVYLECVISEAHYNHGAWDYRIGQEWYEEDQIIPASRVTVAKARRAAEFPKDWGKMAWFSDDGKEWGMSKLTGCDAEGTSNEWCNETGQWFDFCEVEE